MSTPAQIVSVVSRHPHLWSYTDGQQGMPLTLCCAAPLLQFTGQNCPREDIAMPDACQAPDSAWDGRTLTVVVFAMKSVRGTKTVKGPAPLSSLMFSACGRRTFVGRETENTVPVSKTLCRKPSVGFTTQKQGQSCLSLTSIILKNTDASSILPSSLNKEKQLVLAESLPLVPGQSAR